MNYLISKKHCFLNADKIYEIFPNVKYEINFENENVLVYLDNLFQVVNFVTCENVEKIEVNVDNYFLLDFKNFKETENVSLTFRNKMLSITCGTDLKIVYDGVVYLEKEKICVSYSNYEEVGEYLFIYFTGERNFVVCLKNELEFASYYDEINVKEKERYFMCKLFNSLNHGRVYHVKDSVENYLVYLDDYEMNLKGDFCSCVFLDCVLVKDFKYANNLLVKELMQKDEKIISTFFPEFDEYIILNQNLFALKNKNTLAGIFKFEIENLRITNIIQLS